MKNAGKRLMAMLLAVVMLASMVPIMATGVSAATEEGKTFERDTYYDTSKALSGEILTFEAEISIPTTYTKRPGVIVANYGHKTSGKLKFTFEIKNSGKCFYPSLFGYDLNFMYETDENGVADETKPIDVRRAAGTFAHIAVTIDKTNKLAHCYIDGVRKATAKFTKTTITIDTSLVVGGDYRGPHTNNNILNEQYFKGKIKNVKIYSDTRTANEISADAAAFSADKTDTNLLFAYDFTSESPLTDLSANANYLKFNTNAGQKFSSSSPTRKIYNKLTEAPRTYEAVLYCPTAISRPGVILGNYLNGQEPTLNFEIHNNGSPSLYLKNDSKSLQIIFNKENSGVSDVRREGWVHLVVVHDTDEFRCYIDGVLTETIAGTFVPDIGIMQSENLLILGDDTRNNKDFKGIIKHVALYSDILTDSQIASLYKNGVDTTNDSLILYYDMSEGNAQNVVKDLSGNGHHASTEYYEREEEKTDYAYSFAVIGDTQMQVWRDYKSRLDADASNDLYYTDNIYKWVVDNKDKKNIQWVFGVGDITQNNGVANTDPSKTSTPLEWEIAKNAITQLDAADMNYSVIMGNHDTVAQLDKYFADPSDDFYTSRVSGYYQDGSLGNYYMNFEVAGVKYMMLGLEYGANDKILKWASQVVEAHPERRVIVTTHAYMFRDGTTLDKDDVVPPNSSGVTTSDTSKNNGDMMWDKFISQHRNILMVLSGHDPYSNIAFRQDRGVNGNLVSQFLVDPQGMKPEYQMVCMLYFSEDGKDVSVEWISTGKTQAAQKTDPEAKDVIYKSMNQFDFEMYNTEYNFVHSAGIVPEESNEEQTVYRIYYTNGTYSEFVVKNGQDGEKGDQGDQGIKGDKGEKGDQGDQGLQGEKGESGAAGTAGNSPYIGTNGNWYIGDVDTGIKAQGEKGDKGEPGVAGAVGEKGDKGDQGDQGAAGTPGADGQDGSIPYIGINGNWYIEGVDTGIKAKGDKGDTGAQGPQGAPGATGPQGLPGTTGAQGPQGEKGDQGPQGATGSTGAVGAKGDTDVVTILGIMSAACGATTIGMAVVCIIFAKKKQLI